MVSPTNVAFIILLLLSIIISSSCCFGQLMLTDEDQQLGDQHQIIIRNNDQDDGQQQQQQPSEPSASSGGSIPTFSVVFSAFLDMSGGRYIKTYFNDFVLPGTRWCGQGNQAGSANDLGEYSRSDICCRAHDHCRYVITAGQSKWGMQNKESYTISHCNCDKIFHNCLTAKRFDAASCLVWDTYFTMVKAPCFEFEIRNGTKKAVIRKKTFDAPDCSMHRVFREVLRHLMSRLQGKWRRPGQWGDPNDISLTEE